MSHSLTQWSFTVRSVDDRNICVDYERTDDDDEHMKKRGYKNFSVTGGKTLNQIIAQIQEECT